jgi:hypothetical protein
MEEETRYEGLATQAMEHHPLHSHPRPKRDYAPLVNVMESLNLVNFEAILGIFFSILILPRICEMEFTVFKAKEVSGETTHLKLKAFIERQRERQDEAAEEEVSQEGSSGNVAVVLNKIEDDVIHRLQLIAASLEEES